MRVIGRAADQTLVGLEAGAQLCVHDGDELLDLGHGFRADAVAGQEEKTALGHGNSRKFGFTRQDIHLTGFAPFNSSDFAHCNRRFRRMQTNKYGLQGAY